MSTIATPRDTSTFRRAPVTPTSSTRPSLDLPRSTTSSPNPNAGGGSPFLPASAAFASSSSAGAGAAPKQRANRAALREYYNLKKNAAGGGGAPGTPLLEVTDTDSVAGANDDTQQQFSSYSEVPLSEIDADGFDADAYIQARLRDSSLEELLRTYTRVLGEIRALDAEKKALVYDNYSKLITATETIRKVSWEAGSFLFPPLVLPFLAYPIHTSIKDLGTGLFTHSTLRQLLHSLVLLHPSFLD